MSETRTPNYRMMTIAAFLAGGLGGGIAVGMNGGLATRAVAQANPPTAPASAAQPAPVAAAGPIDSNIFVNLVRKTVPGVVNVSTAARVRNAYSYYGGRGGPSGNDPFRRFFEDFFGGRGGFPGY